MYNVAIPPTFRHLPGHSSTSDHFSVIHYTGESEEPALEAGPMHEPVDPIFDNNHFSQGQHPVFEGTDPLYDPPTTYALYPDTYVEHGLFQLTHGFVHQDMLEEIEHRSDLEMTHMDMPLSTTSSAFLDRDVITAWPIRVSDHDDGDGSLGLLSNRLVIEEASSAPEDRETTPGSSTTDFSPSTVNGPHALLASALLLSIPISWWKIPQQIYVPKVGKRSFPRSLVVTFSVHGVPGFNLKCALDRTFAGLDGRDNPVLENAKGPVSCRLLFPGYQMNTHSGQISVKDWRKEPSPIPKSKLAHEVAKRVHQYLVTLAAMSIDPSAGLEWTVGQGFMKFEKMYLTGIYWVSKGSIQPEIWVDTNDS